MLYAQAPAESPGIFQPCAETHGYPKLAPVQLTRSQGEFKVRAGSRR